jgi:hypothetical protein
MRARAARLPNITTSFGPLSDIATRVAREVKLWRWRRERSQNGAPVTQPRRRPGRAFMLESRRPDASPGL